MPHNRCLSQHFFITGTDTGVGKTVVAAILLAGLRCAYWKPIQCGLDEGGDTEAIRRMTGLPDEHFMPEGYCLQTPASPHVAAAQEGVKIEIKKLRLPICHKNLLVEGAGGLMVPLNDTLLMLDLIKLLDLPVLLVARSSLGTINHTLLSLEALRRRENKILGVVLNGERNASNCRSIEHYGQVPVLAELEPLKNLNPASIIAVFQEKFASSFMAS